MTPPHEEDSSERMTTNSSSSEPGPVKLRVAEGVARLALDAPDRRNALDEPALAALIDRAAALRDREDVRAVLLSGRGPVFCAGFDLKAAAADETLMPALIRRLSEAVRTIRRLPVPVVARVQGAAIAGGCALLSACDFVLVAADARLGYPVHRIGISPAVTLPTLLRAVRPGAARALVVRGELVDGREAARFGLATESYPDEGALDDAVESLLRNLVAKPPRALARTKAWLNELERVESDAPFDAAAEASASGAAGEEHRDLLRRAWGSR